MKVMVHHAGLQAMVTHNEGNNVEETVSLLQEAVAIATKVHGPKSGEAEQYKQFLLAIKEQAAELQVGPHYRGCKCQC
jgi:sulfur relay (sulfurtransferase) complex TusBCD TusD component (DsrE family)